MTGASEVAASNLEVAPIQESLVQRDSSVGCYLFGGTAALGIVTTLDDNGFVLAGEATWAIFCVVLHAPDTGGGLYKRLVAICIKGGGEITHGGVLIKIVSLIRRDFLTLGSKIAISDIVVGVAIAAVVDGGTGELAAGVVAKAVGHRLIIAGGAAGERATERIVGVGTLHQTGAAAFVMHAGEQVSLRLVFLRERHVAGQYELLEQVTAGQVLVAE